MRLLLLYLILSGVLQAECIESLRFLAGDWIGEGGGSSFREEVMGRVMIRKNWSDKERHQDSMMIFREGDKCSAIYADNEGHVIRYEVEASASSATFRNPQFRLVYVSSGTDTVRGTFEVGGKPYLAWTLRRK